MVHQISIWEVIENNSNLDSRISLFKERKLKAKEIFEIKEINKNTAYEFIRKYHYLKDAKFFATYSYGLFIENELVGAATYSSPQGTSTLKGWFNLQNSDKSIMELSRLCMLPSLNGCNASSYLLGNSMRMMHNKYKIKAVITLADANRHIGSIYQVCNFKYYGLADKKKDFYRYPNGVKNERGSTNGIEGVWIERTRKHRYAYIFDKNLKCNYLEQPHPTQKEETITRICCNGTNRVYDNRMNIWYSCPICTNKMIKI